jgi:hypothetical protein
MTPAAMADASIAMVLIPVEKGMAAEAAVVVHGLLVPPLSNAGSRAAAVSPTDSAVTGAGVAGAVCVSRPPPRDLAALLAFLLMAFVVAIGEAVGLGRSTGRFPRGRGMRAPPAGTVLLVRLCISRT